MRSRLSRLFNPTVEPMNKIYIYKDNILHNFDYLKSLQPKADIFPVLKSNAYGHGLIQMAQILNKTDAPYLAVDSFPEYQIVKKYSDKNILILGETLQRNYKKFDLSRTTFCVYNIETIRYLAKLRKKIKIHLFLDTGMHREWVNEDELINILEFLKQYPKIKIEWVMSHLHSADNQENNWIQSQIKLFKKMYHIIIDYGHLPQRKHIWNSAWLFKIQDDFFNAFRPGLALYGYSPLNSDDNYYSLTSKLQPALSIKSSIVSIHSISAEEWVSYNHKRLSSDDSIVASIPFWYAEWLPRSASNKIYFKYNKNYIPQIGTICMNLCSLDIEEDASIWDKIEVVWLEWDNTIKKLSENSDRIVYEILVGLDKNIRREIV